MNIEVKQKHVEIQDSVVDNIHRHIEADLERFDHMIKRVCVQIADINGPRGGEDKLCRIQVYLKHASAVIVEDRGSSVFTVVCRAIDRVNMAVSRSTARIRERHRSRRRVSVRRPCAA
jgi:putative sigma-54 modulation protein